MAFKPIGSLNPHGGPILKKVIITNSLATVQEDSVQVASGFLAAGTSGSLVLGHVRAHVDKNGLGLNTTGVAGAAMGSYAGSFTAASDNQTVAKVCALVDISKETLYSVVPNAAIGTTTGSNLLGYFTDIASATATQENSAVTGVAQYGIMGVDPLVSANQIVHVAESQIFGA